MRVGITGRSLLDNPTGIGIYTYELVRALASEFPEVEFTFLNYAFRNAKKRFANAHLPQEPNIQVQNIRFPVPLLLKLWQWKLLSVGSWDIFHSTDHVLPQLSRSTKVVATIHDLSMFEKAHWHTRENRAYYQAQITRIINHADFIITASKFTREQLLSRFVFPADRVKTVYQGGIAPRFSQTSPLPGIEEPFFLYLGTIEPRKNVARLIQAYDLLRQNNPEKKVLLILIGQWGWHFQEVEKAYQNSPFQQDIILKNYVPQHELPSYLQNALALVYPSLYEGFGRPPLEAMTYGTPAIVSQRASLPEVVGQAGVLVDPEQISDIAAGMAQLLSAETREQLAKKALVQAQSFSWQKTAHETMKIYRKLTCKE